MRTSGGCRKPSACWEQLRQLLKNIGSHDLADLAVCAAQELQEAVRCIRESAWKYEKRKELIIDPDFQRHDVWKQRQKSELIESILMGIPIPLMYLFEDKNGKKQVVDGRQRISAILDFLEGKFKLNNLRILKQFNGCCFADLDFEATGSY